MKFFSKLFGRKNRTTTPVRTYTPEEPEFLKEYWVYIGTRSCTTVFARSAEEAKAQVLSDIRNDVPYYDSSYYTSKDPGPKEQYRTYPRGEVYAVFKRTSNLRNPAYRG